MERMVTREHVELFLEDGFEAEIASLRRTDRYRFVLHLSLLVPQDLCVVRKLVQIGLERLNLNLVIAQAIAKVILHVLYLLVGREQRQQVVDLQL